MKFIYTIKIFEFTLTKNGHFVLSVYTEMVLVDYLHVYIKWLKIG